MSKIVSALTLPLCNRCGTDFTDPLTLITRTFLGFFSADRFNILNKESPFDIIEKAHPLPQKTDAVIATLLERRAKELSASGKNISVAFSGGVDSAAMAIALLKEVGPDRLILVSTSSAKFTSPDAFVFFAGQGVRLREVDTIIGYINHAAEDELHAAGYGADILFGANCHRFDVSLYHTPWKEGLEKFLKLKGVFYSAEDFKRLIDAVEEYAEILGLELKEFCEFAWLQNFGLNWSYTADILNLQANNAEARARGVCFFDTDYFSDWSFSNFSNLSAGNPFIDKALYKRALKDYIIENSGLDAYRDLGKTYTPAEKSPAPMEVRVHDETGYKIYRAKDPTVFYRSLAKSVANHYLKPEFQQ